MSFNTKETKRVEGFHLNENEVLTYRVLSEDESETEDCLIAIPYVGKTFAGFKQAVAFKESRGNFTLVNSFGYMGKYQFGVSTLRTVGIYNSEKFLKTPALQEKAFKALIAQNKWILRKEIEKYNGKIIKGIKITESGILAAAHLGGPGSVKKFLKSNGNSGFKDGFGTSLKSYFKKFAGYDVSHIKANKNAKASEF